MSQRERISNVIREYDAQGIHRTATTTDEASAHWLAGHVRAAGLEPRLEGYDVHRLDPGECFLELDGRRIEGVPLFDCTYTDVDGVAGQFCTSTSSDEIALVEVERGHLASNLRTLRRESDAVAIVVVTAGRGGSVFTDGDTRGLVLQNAYDFDEPFGPPVLQVSNEVVEWLRERAEAGTRARVVAPAKRTWATAYNVTAELPGSDPKLKPVAVNTPRSGWWEIAAERGSGIACWLEVMRGLVASGSTRRVFFSANSGHELSFSGMVSVLESYPNLITDATWLHFGANIGATTGTRGNVAASTEALQRIAAAELDSISRPTHYVIGKSNGGEMASVHRRGGRQYLALTNDNAYFHMREDRFSNNIDVDLVTEYASACLRIAQRLVAHSPSDT